MSLTWLGGWGEPNPMVRLTLYLKLQNNAWNFRVHDYDLKETPCKS